MQSSNNFDPLPSTEPGFSDGSQLPGQEQAAEHAALSRMEDCPALETVASTQAMSNREEAFEER